MSIISAGGAVVGSFTQYQIERSLRFNSADSAYLNRTPASAGNRKTWTWSGWVKRSALSSTQGLFARNDGSVASYIIWNSNNKLEFSSASGSAEAQIITTPVYRDASAWYHVIMALDTTQATSSNRVKFYVNGVQVTALDTASYPSQNYDAYVNTTATHYIGNGNPGGSLGWYSNQYLTEINFIDGSALDPTSFGETNPITGVWQPKAYTGSYGTNGFYLNFSDNSGTTSTTLGKDQAGSNNWTPNNFSVTAGAGNDSLVDTPTNYGEDTGVGGEVRGNYATWNSINTLVTLSNGNLDIASLSNYVYGTIQVTSGQWYWEYTITGGSNYNYFIGVANSTASSYVGMGMANGGNSPNIFNMLTSTNGTVTQPTGSRPTKPATIAIRLDVAAGNVHFYINNTLNGSVTGITNWSGFWTPWVSNYTTTFTYQAITANFGQRPFAYTAPSGGFKALCTQNLPEPTIVDGGEYFDATIYAGNNTAGRNVTNSNSFQPDFVWIKNRSGTNNHILTDVLRGVTKTLFSDSTSAELTVAGALTAFNSNGFQVGYDGTAIVNATGNNYVGWQWKANGAGVSNTAGTITSTVSANTDSGFSIVTYTGTATNATVGHGLGVAPSMVIVKNRSAGSTNWCVYHIIVGNQFATLLNSTSTPFSNSNYWNNTTPTSSVFSLGNGTDTNGNTNNLVAYCFAAIPGYSAFGSYTGNGSAAGPFVYTGFRPAFVIVKMSSSTGDWYIFDDARDPYNATQLGLLTNTAQADGTYTGWGDFLSNGFKIRRTDAAWNTNGGTYIYMAFAENPFKYSLAR